MDIKTQTPITPINKTPEQRKAELAELLARPEATAQKPDTMPSGVARMIDLMAGEPVIVAGRSIMTLPVREAWRAYVSAKGTNKGKTIHTALGYREGNFALGKPVDGYQLFVSLNIAFVPSTAK